MPTMIVHNLTGTGDNTCTCGTWLAHWASYTGRVPRFCSVIGCGDYATLGAHVMRPGDRTWYIVPMCAEHNAQKGPLSIGDSTELVPANVQQTCGA